MTEMQGQAENVGARVIYDIVTTLNTSIHPFRLTFDSGRFMSADAVILATGAQARWLGLESGIDCLMVVVFLPVQPVTDFSIKTVMLR